MREFMAFAGVGLALTVAVLAHWLQWGMAARVVFTAVAIFDLALLAAVLAYHERQWRK